MAKRKLSEKWLELYEDARAKRKEIDAKIKRRTDLYKGLAQPIDPKTGLTATKRAACKRNMCFELIETQINNAIPAPKVTPRDANDIELATMLENYLQMEMDRMSSEAINDAAERGTLKQGTAFYLVGWDEGQKTPITSGELFVKYYPIDQVYPQPGISNIEDAEYIFVKDLVSIRKIKDVWGVTAPESPEYKGLANLITCYYLNDKGYLCRYGWIENTDCVVFDEQDYELRKIKVCKECGEPLHGQDVCPLCGSDKYEYEGLESETMAEDIVRGDPSKPDEQPEVLVKAGESLPYYKIGQLPFVVRRNISDDTSFYGVSDIDLLEENQISMNKILTKMEENVLKAGSFVTKLKGVNIPNNDETLKVVTLTDPQQVKGFSVQTVQANMQQDNILQEEFYQMGRDSLGITDSYQGKRDTTAESGKAKQVSAAQAAGRLESKRRMKDAAYADLYKLMFKFLLAYCDEPRTFSMMKATGEYVPEKFSRYRFISGEPGEAYYNDRFLFSVDDASTLATNRSAMWAETTNNFAAGTFGNPADPQTLLLYWNIMKGLNYPLAKYAISSLRERQQELPYELQQAIMQNPEILQQVQALAQGGGETNENRQQ